MRGGREVIKSVEEWWRCGRCKVDVVTWLSLLDGFVNAFHELQKSLAHWIQTKTKCEREEQHTDSFTMPWLFRYCAIPLTSSI